jgi:hypothetical protein
MSGKYRLAHPFAALQLRENHLLKVAKNRRTLACRLFVTHPPVKSRAMAARKKGQFVKMDS